MKTDKAIRRIEQLLNACSEGNTVSRRDLSRVLPEKLMQEFDDAWATEKSTRKAAKPTKLVKYDALLKKGLLAYGQYESKQHRLASERSVRLFQQAESQLELALEYAIELLQSEPELIVWFDRDPRQVSGLDSISMPRLITSKSTENQSASKAPPMQQSINDLKLVYLARALEELRPDTRNLEFLASADLPTTKLKVRKRNFDDFKF